MGPPPKYPPDYVGVFSRGYVGGGPILWGCRISKQSLKTAEMSHISVVFLFKDCFEIRRPHTMGPPPKYPPDYCGGFYKGVCWGRSHSCVVLSNFETVFKNSWKVTFQLFRNSTTPYNGTAPKIVWGFSKGEPPKTVFILGQHTIGVV